MSIVERREDGTWIDVSGFRTAGDYFLKHNENYCLEPWGSPAWYEFWKEERNRCRNGITVDGHKIPGDYYFYLNYCPIQKVDIANATGRIAQKIEGFPDFWEGDYEYFWCREIARHGVLKATGVDEEEQKRVAGLPEEERYPILMQHFKKLGIKIQPLLDQLDGGRDMIIGKSRRKGFSYKNASIAVCNYFHRPKSYTMLIAYEKKYLFPGKKTIFGKCKEYINFVNKHTAWKLPAEYINTQSHIKASHKETKDGVDIEVGFLSEIEAISFKDNPDAGRGADAYDIIGEEVGAWGTVGGLKNTLAAMRSSSEAGNFKTGMITLFGCVCKGTKVWTKDGILTTIENITKNTGILGYATKGTIQENIPWLQPPGQKECVRITTDKGYVIECSKDHPLLWSKRSYRDGKNKYATFKRAENIEVGDRLLQVRQVPQFGNKQMWYPRLVGMLIGDGYYGTHYSSAQLCIAQEEILDYIDMLGIGYKIYEGKSCDKPFFRYITLHGTQQEMRLLGLQGQSKNKKRLPDNIWQYDKNSVAELIGGLFDADGSVQDNKHKKKISLCSVVPELLDEVRTQLFKLGIQANIYKRKHQDSVLRSNVNNKWSVIKGKYSYTLEICDLESIRNFKKHIHLIVESKRDKLNSWDLTEGKTEKTKKYLYKQTIEKGAWFVNNPELEYLTHRRVEKIEDIGLQDIYNLSTEFTHTYITNGFISHNTSGDMQGGTVDFADLFRRPQANGFMAFYDRWGKFKDKVEGFFFAKQMNMEGFYDKNGNSDMEGAMQAELSTRKHLIENGATSTEIQKRMQEEPLNSAEAFAMIATNTFPVVELQAQLDKVVAMNLQTLKGTPVKLHYVDGVITASPILNGSAKPITSFKDIPLDIQGCPMIYEHPVPDAPPGLYKIGYDPIRQEQGTSLAAIIVYKGTMFGSYSHDIPVAEYIGRYEDPDDIDRVAEMFADLYNTKIMYENEVTGVKNYFRRIKRLSLLALQPDTVISKNIKASKVARVYGCHMNEQLKDAGERYVKSWLLSVLDHDENGNPIRVIDKIYSIRLLEELISYYRKGNFDLVSSLFMCMFQVQEEVLGKAYTEEEETPRSRKYRQLLELMENQYK